MSGALQSHGTCWFYSILNQFLLADGMLKILFWNMNEQYKRMTPAEKDFFDAPMDIVCPLGSKFNKIYFYKFLDQYACLQGGPGQLRKQAGLSPNILKRLSAPVNATYRQEGGLGGSYPTPELITVFKNLDIKSWSHKAINSYPKHFTTFVKDTFTNQTDHFIVCYRGISAEYPIWSSSNKIEKLWNSNYPRQVKVGSRIFDLSSCTVSLRNKNFMGKHSGHAICGYIDMNGKGYLFDSNQMSQYFPCNWWIPSQLLLSVRQLGKFYPQFQGDGITEVGIMNMSYVRRTFASAVSVFCRLRARKLNFNTRVFMHYRNIQELLNNLNTKTKLGILSAAQRQKIIKNYLAKKQPTPKKTPIKVSFENIKNTLTKSTVRTLINSGYTFSPSTKEKIKNFFIKKATSGTPTSPINFGNKKAPSPPRKKKRTPTPSPRSEIINLRTPSPSPRSEIINLRTPSPGRSNLNKAKSVAAKFKTMKNRKAYKRTRAVNMSQNNWYELGRFINRLDWEKRKRLENTRQLKKKV